MQRNAMITDCHAVWKKGTYTQSEIRFINMDGTRPVFDKKKDKLGLVKFNLF